LCPTDRHTDEATADATDRVVTGHLRPKVEGGQWPVASAVTSYACRSVGRNSRRETECAMLA